MWHALLHGGGGAWPGQGQDFVGGQQLEAHLDVGASFLVVVQEGQRLAQAVVCRGEVQHVLADDGVEVGQGFLSKVGREVRRGGLGMKRGGR